MKEKERKTIPLKFKEIFVYTDGYFLQCIIIINKIIKYSVILFFIKHFTSLIRLQRKNEIFILQTISSLKLFYYNQFYKKEKKN